MIIDPNILSERLRSTLPGQQAQYEMASLRRKLELIDFENLRDYKESAVCLLLRPTDKTTYFYLIERAVYDGVHSGQIAFPGGKKDEIDKDLNETALRELHEETGLKLDANAILGSLSRLYIPPSNFMVFPVVAWIEHSPSFQINIREVQTILEVEIGDLLSQDTLKETIVEVGGIKIKTPYFKLRGKIVWGATAMILNEFRTIISSFQFQ